jgi:ABC-type transport system involved in multi-copper enzyme maturation permease subunit
MALATNLQGLYGVWTRSTPSDDFFLVQSVIVLALFALGVGIRCAGVVSSERERKTWDLLLTTPMEPRHLLRGKLWGVIDSARPYLLAYIIPATLLAVGGGLLAVIWVVFWWAVSWVLMLFMGATGVRCSVRSQNSWRSLLASLLASAWTIGLRFAIVGVPVGFLATAGVVGVLHAAILAPGAWLLVSKVTFVLLSFAMTMFLLIGQAEYQLTSAEQWINQYERIAPHTLRSPRVRRGVRHMP